MVRTLTPNAQSKLLQQYGAEPVVIIEIQWVDGGQVCAYADRKVADSVLGQIVEIGNIDGTVTVEGNSDSTQMEVVLDDSDGAIKGLMDGNDFHKRPVWVYQWFDGLDLADKFLLFKGEINSPVQWSEGDRTLRFDVTTPVEDVEVGFSMEEGDFPVVPDDALGVAWPLCFGTVCDVKVPRVQSPRYGVLQSGEGIHDFTIEPRICQAKFIQCPTVPLGTEDRITPIQTQPTGTGSTGTTGSTEPQSGYKVETVDRYGPDQACVEERFDIICNLMYQLQQQQAYEHATMTIQGGSRFPQNERITLNIEGGKFTGRFTGDVFHIASREHPAKATSTMPACRPIVDHAYTQGAVLEQSEWTQTETGTAWYDRRAANIDPTDYTGYCNEQINTQIGRKSVGGPVDSRQAYDDMPTSNFFWARAGSKVYLEDEAEVLFIVNLLPSTILRVAAFQQTNFGPRLITVPSELYTIYETNYGGYTVTEIGMTKPLSQVDAKWSDDIYVTLTSSVGPNPVDIIEWLVNTYTRLSIDWASFTHVRERLANYPSNFALLERKNVMELIREIAFQSRCVVYVRNDTVFLKYYSEEPTPAATITESDVAAGSLRLSLSNTEEVATKHSVTWRKTYRDDQEALKLILKHNVAKYGTHAQDWDYYTQNIYEDVLKSATFWMIRQANTWKMAEFTTTLRYLDLEVFDCVTLDLPDIAPDPIKAVITGVSYNISDREVSFTCWLPLKAGETTPYIFAWPADVDRHLIFPTAEERKAGLGYQFEVAPPAGHLLRSIEAEDDGNPSVTLTSGDEHPSDLDDDYHACFCPSTDQPVIEEEDPTFKLLQKINRTQLRQDMDRGQGGGGSDKNKKVDRGCGTTGSPGGGCVYEVKVTYCTPILVGTGMGGCAGPCAEGAGPGLVCTGTFHVMCHTFGAMFSAQLFKMQKQAEIPPRCGWYSGRTAVYSVGLHAIADPNPIGLGGGCEDPPGDANAPNQGQISSPADGGSY